MSKLHIIGLCGHINAGKDSVGQILVAHAGFRQMSFAGPLKAEASEAFQVEPAVFVRREQKEQPMQELALERCSDQAFVAMALLHLVEREPGVPRAQQLARPRSPRQIMQLWGTEYRRAQKPNYWARRVCSHISYLHDALRESRFVVTDVRFPNEAESLRNMGGKIWQIKRPGADQGTAGDGHVSRNDGSQFAPDAVINNVYDLKHLAQLVLGEFWARDSGLSRVDVRISWPTT